jgi:hypothetical protein
MASTPDGRKGEGLGVNDEVMRVAGTRTRTRTCTRTRTQRTQRTRARTLGRTVVTHLRRSRTCIYLLIVCCVCAQADEEFVRGEAGYRGQHFQAVEAHRTTDDNGRVMLTWTLYVCGEAFGQTVTLHLGSALGGSGSRIEGL